MYFCFSVCIFNLHKWHYFIYRILFLLYSFHITVLRLIYSLCAHLDQLLLIAV